MPEPTPLSPPRFDLNLVPSPSYVVDLGVLRDNGRILDRVRKESSAEILIALKGFALWGVFAELTDFLDGTAASSIHEARLGREAFGAHVHACAPAYRDSELPAYLEYCSHMSFNSLSQWERHRAAIEEAGEAISPGLRINPEHHEVATALYDPCGKGSRLGVRADELTGYDLAGLQGFHFHNLCEKNADALERTLRAVEEGFGPLLEKLAWVNMGGGHHITRSDYDAALLVQLIKDFAEKYGVQVVLEPGEAVALNAGWLVCEVLDIIENHGKIAILDTSAAAHMPDVLEMPYRPELAGAGPPGRLAHTYRLGGLTCLAGDVIGEYSFDEPLVVGQRLAFTDMAHYTMVKNTMFNGIGLPAIVTYEPDRDSLRVLKTFDYADYRDRLS